jgi:hypothetical protein
MSGEKGCSNEIIACLAPLAFLAFLALSEAKE